MLKTIFDRLRLEFDELYVGEIIVDNETGNITNHQLFNPDGLTGQIKLNVILLTCAMLYNYSQLTVELFIEEPNSFTTFCHLIETIIPSSLSTLTADKNVPCMSPYETKLLVCGLSRVFFGKANSVYIPTDDLSPS